MANGALLRRSQFSYTASASVRITSPSALISQRATQQRDLYQSPLHSLPHFRHRHTAAATANHHMPLFEHNSMASLSRILRGCGDATTRPNIYHHVSSASRKPLPVPLVFWLINRTNKFLWLQKRRIISETSMRVSTVVTGGICGCALNSAPAYSQSSPDFLPPAHPAIRFYLFPRQILQCQQPHLRPLP